MKTLTIKVGQMPGKLSEVVIESGTSAREIFELANVEINNHEVRLDGSKIDIDSVIYEGSLLVAMKQIKGNARTIKCGLMPGKLQVIEYEVGETARNVFSRAGIELTNHEIRLDGNTIDIDSDITDGTLLVGLKQIKGNAGHYVTELSEEEIQMLLNVELPTVIESCDVMDIGDNCTLILDIIVDTDMFNSVYELKELIEITEEIIPIAHECKCKSNKGKEFIEAKISELRQQTDYHWNEYKRYNSQIELLEEVLDNM